MGLPGFEPGSQAPKARRLARLPHSPNLKFREKHLLNFCLNKYAATDSRRTSFRGSLPLTCYG